MLDFEISPIDSSVGINDRLIVVDFLFNCDHPGFPSFLFLLRSICLDLFSFPFYKTTFSIFYIYFHLLGLADCAVFPGSKRLPISANTIRPGTHLSVELLNFWSSPLTLLCFLSILGWVFFLHYQMGKYVVFFSGQKK